MSREVRWYYALIWLHGDELEVHKFTMEHTVEQSHYRAISSYNAFEDRNCRQVADGKIFGYRASMRSERDWEMDMRFGDRAFAPDVFPRRELPMFEHASIWDFYIAVGYDYKQKKWIRELPADQERAHG